MQNSYCDHRNVDGVNQAEIYCILLCSEIYKCVRHRAKWGDLLPVDVERKDQVVEEEKANT